jgi:hypothetical protein
MSRFDDVFGKPTNIERIDIGDQVICDWGDPSCNVEADGPSIVFGSKACCPACTVRVMELVRKNPSEKRFIREGSEPGESFRKFVYRLRDGKPGTISIISYGPRFDEELKRNIEDGGGNER